MIVQFSCSVMSNALQPVNLSMPGDCPSLTPKVQPNPCSLSQWCHPTVSSSVVPFSPCPQSFPASGSFKMSQLFESDGQNIGVLTSTSVLPMNIPGWFPLVLLGLLSLLCKEFSGVFSSTTIWRHQFFSSQPSLRSNSHICTWHWATRALTMVDMYLYRILK